VNTLRRKLRVSVHRGIVDKNVPEDRLYAEGWENVELTPEELIESVKNGHPYCAQISGYRNAKHFRASDVVSLDIEHSLSIDEALENPIVRAHATILYTTVRHQLDAHRFRIIFVLPRTITDAREMAALVEALRLRVAGDRNAVDPARMFFGNRNAEVVMFDREISPALLGELIAQGLNPPEPDTVVNGGGAAHWVPSRSRLLLRPEQEIWVAKGGLARFADLPPLTIVHCPFHNDKHASAFIVANRHGVNGIYCSTCACTYWPEGLPSPDDDVFDNFEKTVREAARYYQDHQDYGPLAPLLGFSQSQPGLIGSTIRIVAGSPTPPGLVRGLMMVRSPKGTGKTARLKSLLHNSSSVLLIGHRRALIRQTCDRLNLHCYLDDEGRPDVDRHTRYGICLDSLGKIPASAWFDVIVLDESEQVLAHFLSDTMDRGGGSRDRIFVEFRRLLRRAKTVIALDADLGWVTFRTLSRMDERKEKHLWMNDAKPGEGKVVQVFDSEAHLAAQLRQAVADGKRCFVTSNSKAKMAKLAAAISDEFPAKSAILITSDTVKSGNKAVREFIADPQSAEAANYDIVFASPSIGTGVDIAFPDKAQVFEVVFGFCEAQITTHLEFDQQLARVRHPGAVKAWVNPRRFHFETEFDVVRRDALERSLFKNLLLGYADSGEPEYQENDAFLEMASLILSEERASKNDVRGNFIRHKLKQGFQIEHIHKDESLHAQGRGVLAKGKHLSDEKYGQAILSANSPTGTEFKRIREALKAGEWVSDTEMFSYEKASLELFYGEPVTESLIRTDDRGRFRNRVRLFEAVFESPSLTKLNFLDRRRLAVTKASKATAIMMLLRLTPLMKGGRLDTEVVVQHSDLLGFADALAEQKAVIETHLGLEVRSDHKNKSTQQLGGILQLPAHRLERMASPKHKGQKIYQYRLEPKSVAGMKAIVGARKAQGQRQSGGRLFGSAKDDASNDENEEAGDN